MARFGHREHLELAWTHLRGEDPATAFTRVLEVIRGVAAGHGAPEKVNVTMTRFWVHVVAVAVARANDPDDFARLLAQYPHLEDKELPFRHWSRAALTSSAARADWLEPDLRPLPTVQ